MYENINISQIKYLKEIYEFSKGGNFKKLITHRYCGNTQLAKLFYEDFKKKNCKQDWQLAYIEKSMRCDFFNPFQQFTEAKNQRFSLGMFFENLQYKKVKFTKMIGCEEKVRLLLDVILIIQMGINEDNYKSEETKTKIESMDYLQKQQNKLFKDFSLKVKIENLCGLLFEDKQSIKKDNNTQTKTYERPLDGFDFKKFKVPSSIYLKKLIHKLEDGDKMNFKQFENEVVNRYEEILQSPCYEKLEGNGFNKNIFKFEGIRAGEIECEGVFYNSKTKNLTIIDAKNYNYETFLKSEGKWKTNKEGKTNMLLNSIYQTNLFSQFGFKDLKIESVSLLYVFNEKTHMYVKQIEVNDKPNQILKQCCRNFKNEIRFVK